MSLIGQRCKHSNVFSWLILISRKLDLKQAQCCLTLDNCKRKRCSVFRAHKNAKCIMQNAQLWQEPYRPEKQLWEMFWREVKGCNVRQLCIVHWALCIEYAPLAQLVEQLTLNQWVPGSSPWRRTKWPVGQVVKTEASHAFNIGSNPVRVTTF